MIIDLSYNQIDDEGIQYLANVLQNNKVNNIISFVSILLLLQTLIRFNLRHNQIGEQGAYYLRDAFRTNRVKSSYVSSFIHIDTFDLVDLDKTSARQQ